MPILRTGKLRWRDLPKQAIYSVAESGFHGWLVCVSCQLCISFTAAPELVLISFNQCSQVMNCICIGDPRRRLGSALKSLECQTKERLPPITFGTKSNIKERKGNSKTIGFCPIGDWRQGRAFVVGFTMFDGRYLKKERASFSCRPQLWRQRKPSLVFLNNMIQEGLWLLLLIPHERVLGLNI